MARMVQLLNGATAVAQSGVAGGIADGAIDTDNRTFQAVGTTSSGAGACTVALDGSNDGVNWINFGSISLTLSTTAATDGGVFSAPWFNVRAYVSAISGTGASVSVYMGY